LQQSYAELVKLGAEVFAVNLHEDAKTIAPYLKANGLTMPVLLDRTASPSSANQLYGVYGIPTTFVIKLDGKIGWVRIGSWPDDAAQVTDAVRKGLALTRAPSRLEDSFQAAGKTAPLFSLKDLEGGTVELASYVGRKIVVLLFWRTGDEAPMAALHQLQQSYSEFVRQGVEILTVNVDADRASPGPKARDLGITMPVLVDPAGLLGKQYGVSATPATFIIGLDGRIASTVRGHSTQSPTHATDAIRQVLRATPVPPDPRSVWTRLTDADAQPWAAEQVDRMHLDGVLRSYPDGTLRGGETISRAEAVVMVVRLMGLEAEASTLSQEPLPLSDAASVPDWARGHVAVAVQRGILWPGWRRAPFESPRAVTRAEVGTLLVNAVGLRSANGTGLAGWARGLMARFSLPFKDRKAIPSRLAGHVATAVARGIVRGYEDKTFRPGGSVTRAEMAVFCARTQERMANPPAGKGLIQGAIVSVGTQSITIKLTERAREYAVARNAVIYLDGQPSRLGGLTAGMPVGVAVRDSMVVLVAAKSTPK
jgi:peroxiredoxin